MRSCRSGCSGGGLSRDQKTARSGRQRAVRRDRAELPLEEPLERLRRQFSAGCVLGFVPADFATSSETELKRQRPQQIEGQDERLEEVRHVENVESCRRET